MRALIWSVGLFALAVVTTLAAHYNSGYVLIAVPTHRIEISLNLAIVLLIAACLLFHMLANAAQMVLTLPGKARQFRQDVQRQKSARALEETLAAYFESRHGRALRAARRVTEREHRALADVICARASHELRNFQQRDDHLRHLESQNPDRAYLRLMTQADLLLQERRYHDTLAVLARLPEKHSEALKLELRAQQLARQWDQVLALLPQLERRGIFERSVLEKLRRHCHRENLLARGGDLHGLREYWKRVAEADRRDPQVAFAAARGFLAEGARGEASSLIEECLAHEWAPALLESYAETAEGDARRQLERAEEWLRANPRDADLLLALGRLCAGASLWGKARSYLEASLAIDDRLVTHLELARLLTRIGETESAQQHHERALALAHPGPN